MNKKGFTLVELLAVIAILAILVILALPNVLKLFNRATKDTFDTEVKTIIQTVQKQWLSDYISGSMGEEIVYCRVNGVDCDNSLQLDGDETVDYYVKVDSQGNISQIGVTDDKHQFKSDKKGIKAGDEIISSVIAELPEDQIFQVTKDGILLKNEIVSLTKVKMNEYGFFYDMKYTGSIGSDYVDSILYMIFEKTGTTKMWVELGEQDYYNNKETLDNDLECSDYNCAKTNFNYTLFGSIDGFISSNTKYEKSHVSISDEDGNIMFDFYFTPNGRKLYVEEMFTADLKTDGFIIEDDGNFNEYGFFQDVEYVGALAENYVDSKIYIIFQRDGTVRLKEELGEQDYITYKKEIDSDLGSTTYLEAKNNWNYKYGDKVNGLVAQNAVYNQNHVYIDYEKYNGSVTFRYKINFYFSLDGRTVYMDEKYEHPVAYYK